MDENVWYISLIILFSLFPGSTFLKLSYRGKFIKFLPFLVCCQEGSELQVSKEIFPGETITIF